MRIKEALQLAEVSQVSQACAFAEYDPVNTVQLHKNCKVRLIASSVCSVGVELQ